MLPRIHVFGPLELPTYGLMLALGFVLALLLVERLARRAGFAPHVMQDVAVRGSLWGLVGAKLLLVALNPREFLEQPASILFQAGVFYGGLVAAIVAGTLRARKLGLDPHAVSDLVAPALALGHAFGRLGCFLAGCCWGVSCDLPWAVHYTDPKSIAASTGLPPFVGVHPVQLYEAGANLLLCLLALAMLRRRPFPGAVFWSYVGVYGAFRIAVEELRGDPRGFVLDGRVSTSQVMGAIAVVASVAVLAALSRRHRGVRAETPDAAPPRAPADQSPDADAEAGAAVAAVPEP
jgi:phosphatidylglycerol:prolipoprotein diacylglycerol transferase